MYVYFDIYCKYRYMYVYFDIYCIYRYRTSRKTPIL